MTRRDATRKLLSYTLALIFIALLNYQILPLFPLPLPLLLPLAAVAVGCLEGAQFGAGYGIGAGLFLAVLGHQGWENVALLSAVGWVCGLLGQYVLRQDLWGHLICCILLLLFWQTAHVGTLLIHNLSLSPSTVLMLAGWESLSSLVWAFPIYGIHLFCCTRYGRIYHA